MNRNNYQTFIRRATGLLLFVLCTATTWAKYSITFEPNYSGCGTAINRSADFDGSKYYIAINYVWFEEQFGRGDGWTISGWATTADGPIVYEADATVTVTSNITLYAKWDLSVNATFTVDGLNYKVTSISPKVVELTGYEGSKPTGELTIPATVSGITVTAIGVQAFKDCTGLTDITIPATVTTIEDRAFKGCSSLTAVVIPASVNHIGDAAFSECTSLATVYIYGEGLWIGYNAFIPNADSRKFYVWDEYTVGFTDDQRTSNYFGAFVEYDHGVDGVKAHQNPEATNEYWFTFYHPAANVEIGETKFDVDIYKATLNGMNSVTLTKIEGNKIKAGNAVLVRLVKASSLDWNSDRDVQIGIEPAEVEGDYSDNDLRGGATVADGMVAYTLAAKNGKMGFYKFVGASLDPNKVHLECPVAYARPFFGFEEDGTTEIISSAPDPSFQKEWTWYDLSGRRVMKPANGLYIMKGKKVVVK